MNIKSKLTIKNFILLILSIFWAHSIYAQIPYKKSGEKYDISDFRGSIYLDKKFKNGVVDDGLAKNKKNVFLRYDALNDVFEMKQSFSQGEHEFLKQAIEIHLTLEGRNFHYQYYKNYDGQNVWGYLHKIADFGNKSIYIKYGKKLIMPKKAKTSLEKDLPGKIKDNKYYVVDQVGQLGYAKINKKNITEYLPKDKQKQLKEFIKKEKLKFKDDLDFKKLADYCKTL